MATQRASVTSKINGHGKVSPEATTKLVDGAVVEEFAMAPLESSGAVVWGHCHDRFDGVLAESLGPAATLRFRRRTRLNRSPCQRSTQPGRGW
jgi:hypothetical protein